ncbi:MAG: type II toxin-antitoxin system HicB family antitoxin [Patescibacteria group bacterium]
MTHKRTYNVIFKPEPDGGFTAIVPTLPGCVTYGKTLLEAKTMIIDAIGGYIASLTKHEEPIPSDESAFFTTVNLAVPDARHAYA